MRCAQIQRHGVLLLAVLELATATRLQGDGTCAAGRGPHHLPQHSEATTAAPVLYHHHTRCKDCNSGTKARPLSESELARGTEGLKEGHDGGGV
jgi:hypothetical protein